MKAFLLTALLSAAPAFATDRPVDIRLFSLHKITSVNLEPDGGSVSADGRALKGPARAAVRGQAVALDGPL